MRMLDLFAGRLGWSKAFLARGWEVTAFDLVRPPEVPKGVTFYAADVLTIQKNELRFYDFVCASPPCEEFSVHGMKHFHPNPKYPANGIKLFEHTRSICEASGVPYVIENVRAAQQFVGKAVHHCGPFYLWGTGVPPILPQGVIKGFQLGWDKFGKRILHGSRKYWSHTPARKEAIAMAALIPPELASCVCDFAERICQAVNSQ